MKKKKKNGTPIFWGSGTPTFWLGLLLFIKRESRTPTSKILVRTLVSRQFEHVPTTYAFIKKIRKNIAQVHC